MLRSRRIPSPAWVYRASATWVHTPTITLLGQPLLVVLVLAVLVSHALKALPEVLPTLSRRLVVHPGLLSIQVAHVLHPAHNARSGILDLTPARQTEP